MTEKKKDKKKGVVFKFFRAEVKDISPDEEGVINVLIPMSTGSIDRHGESIDPKGWKKYLKEFKKRAILLSSHAYYKLTNQIGELLDIQVVDEGLLAKPKYYINQGNEEADWGYKLALRGMAAFSVGFIPIKWEDNEDADGIDEPLRVYTQQELVEISQVTVPSQRDAIQEMRNKSSDIFTNRLLDDILSEDGLIEIVEKAKYDCECIKCGYKMTSSKHCKEIKCPKCGGTMRQVGRPGPGEESAETVEEGVIPYKETSKAPEDEEWDAGKEVKAAEISDLKIMCTWVDSENAENKGAYKLPHHKAKGHAVVWRGVAAAMAALLGARGGVAIPDKDRKGCYNHLVKHYKQFDKEPPEFKEYSEDELKALFPEGKEAEGILFTVEKTGDSSTELYTRKIKEMLPELSVDGVDFILELLKDRNELQAEVNELTVKGEQDDKMLKWYHETYVKMSLEEQAREKEARKVLDDNEGDDLKTREGKDDDTVIEIEDGKEEDEGKEKEEDEKSIELDEEVIAKAISDQMGYLVGKVKK